MPYSGKNKCELTCKPETANFYYKWADKVIDGTRCDNFGDEICVDGYCLPVGCDGAIMGGKRVYIRQYVQPFLKRIVDLEIRIFIKPSFQP